METVVTVSHATVAEFKQTSDLKQLKILCRKVTGEQLKIFDEDIIVIVRASNKKIIGFCNISMKSPEVHFDNEAETDVAYLYNYITDLSQRKKKASVALMNYIKKLYKEATMNLDVALENTHASKFFERNGFMEVGEYKKSIQKYHMYTFSGTTAD